MAETNSLCGAKTQSGGTCKNKAGFRTEHPGFGKSFKHGGASQNGTKAAARAAVMAMASEVDAEPSEVLLRFSHQDLPSTDGQERRLCGSAP